MANNVDPNEMPHPAASHLGLHCLLRPVCPNTYGKYGRQDRACLFGSSVLTFSSDSLNDLRTMYLFDRNAI